MVDFNEGRDPKGTHPSWPWDGLLIQVRHNAQPLFIVAADSIVGRESRYGSGMTDGYKEGL